MDVQRLLDPDIAKALAAFPLDLGGLSPEMAKAIREAPTIVPELTDLVERTDVVVPGLEEGDPEVPLRVHRPKGLAGPLPCVYWMHGGGYVIGSYSMDDARFDRWCTLFGCVGVSALWCLVYIVSSWDSTKAMSQVGNYEVWVSKPAWFGMTLAIGAAVVSLVGTIFGLKDVGR